MCRQKNRVTNIGAHKPHHRAVSCLLAHLRPQQAAAAAFVLFVFLCSSAQAYITALSNSPDPFDNTVAGQTTWFQATPESGTTAFPTRSYHNNNWDLTLDLFDTSGNHVRRLWADYLSVWPTAPNTNLPPMYDGYGKWDYLTNTRGAGGLAYGTYQAKLFQGFNPVYSTKAPTVFLMGQPTGIFVSGDGTVYVVNNSTKKVLRYSSDGTLLLGGFDITLGNPNNSLQGVAVDSSGRILVSEYDITNGVSRVQRYTAAGILDNACFIGWSITPCFHNNPGIKIADGMAIDASNNIYVADQNDGGVGKFKKFAAAGGNVAPSLTINAPMGSKAVDLAVDPSNGDLYLLESDMGSTGPGGNKTSTSVSYVSRYTSAGAAVWQTCGKKGCTPLSYEVPATKTAGMDPLGIGIGNTYFYVSASCYKSEYITNGIISDCKTGYNTMFSFAKQGATSADPPATYTDEFDVRTNGGDGTNQFLAPHGVAVNRTNNQVFVAESGNNRIKVLDTASGVMSYNSTIFDELSVPLPTEVDVDQYGNVYVAVSESGIIKKYNSDGQYLCTLGGRGAGTGKFTRIFGIGVSDDGMYMYVSDVADTTRTEMIEQFIFTDTSACNGAWTDNTYWPLCRPSNPNCHMQTGNGWSGPRGIAVQNGVPGNQAEVFIVHDQAGKVFHYTPAGDELSPTYNIGADGRGVAVDDKGWMYVVLDSGRVEKYNRNSGANVTTVDLPEIDRGGGIAVDGRGSLYVTDRGDFDAAVPSKGMTVHRLANYIRYNQTDGSGATHIIKWQSHFLGNCDPTLAACTPPSSTDGKFNAPWGVGVANDSSYVWVSDYGGNRIQKFTASYLNTLTEDITIGSASQPPTVSQVTVSPASPVPAGSLAVNVNFNKSMQTYSSPQVTVLTQNNCPLQIYDEAVVDDVDSSNTYTAGDTLYSGVTPLLNSPLAGFRNADPKEGYVEFPLGGGNNVWNNTTGEPIVRDGTGSYNGTFNATTDLVLYATQTSPLGIPLDLNGYAFDLFGNNIKHTEPGPTAGYFDGYFVTNQWRGWVVVPSGTAACCGSSCDGVAQVRVEHGKDAAGTFQSPDPWDCNTASPCFNFVIDTTAPANLQITDPPDGYSTSHNSVAVTGTYNDANGKQVTVVNTNFSCIVRENAASLNNIYNSGVDTVISGTCTDGQSLMPMTTSEGFIDINGDGAYNSTEPVIGDYYNITPGTPLYDAGAEPCTNCDRVLVDAGSYANLSPVKYFSTYDPYVKTNMISSQIVVTTGNYVANDISLPNYGNYYITAIAEDNAGNKSPYIAKRVKVIRTSGSPGVAQINPSNTVSVDSTGVWQITYTSTVGFDYPADIGNCDCAAAPGSNTECYITATIPTGWVAPGTTPNIDGYVTASVTGDTLLCASPVSISGQVVKVKIDKMNAGQDIVISYGYSGGGSEVTSIATLGGNTFVVNSKNYNDPSALNVPPVTGKTLTVPVEGIPVRVSHVPGMPSIIYDYTSGIKIMDLNFENMNTVGSNKTQQISSIKLKYIPNSTQAAASVVTRVIVRSAGVDYLNTTSISSITDINNVMTLTLSPPLEVTESSVKPAEILMDFNGVSFATPALTSLKFLLDGDADTATGTSTALSATVLTSSTANWATNQWVSYTLIPDVTQPTKSYIVQSNTQTAITIKTGSMTGDGLTSGKTFALGDASNSVETRDKITGTLLKVAPRTGLVTDTFYPDYGAANPEMSSGTATAFKSAPVGNNIVVTRSNTWTTGQVVSRGQTGTKPFALRFRLLDQVVNTTNTGDTCTNCSQVTVNYTGSFTGLVGQEIIVGDDDGYATSTITAVDPVAKTISFAPVAGPYAKTRNMYVMRTGAAAKITKIVFTLYECIGGTTCTPAETTNPKALIDALALRKSGTTDYYVNKLDAQLESTGSTVTMSLTTPITLQDTSSAIADLLLDIDPTTTATRLQIGIKSVTAIYPHSRKSLTADCAGCSRVYFNNTVTNDIVTNESLYITTDGSTGDWQTVAPPETTTYVDTFSPFSGSYTVAGGSFVEHTKIKAGYLTGSLQTFPLDSIVANILNNANIQINKVTIYDQADPSTPLCTLNADGSGTTANPEVFFGTGLIYNVELMNTAGTPGSEAFVDAKSNDLIFIRNSDRVDYSSEFTVTPVDTSNMSCPYDACIGAMATATVQYQIQQNLGTTLAPSSTANYFFIDTASNPVFISPDCDETKAGRYHPLSYDSTDYLDTSKFCVNTDSDGVHNYPASIPSFCKLSIKSSPAYALASAVPVRYVGAGSSDILILNTTVHDGPGDNAGQIMTQYKVQSVNATDTSVRAVELWKDDGDGVFEPYNATHKVTQMIIQDCVACNKLTVNDASLFSVGNNVTVCLNSACSASEARTVLSRDTVSSPNTITLSSAIAGSIVYQLGTTPAPEAYLRNDTLGAGGDTLVGSTTFSGGYATFGGLTESIPSAGYNRYFVSYNIETKMDTALGFVDGSIIDAAVAAGGITFQANPAAVAAISGAALNSPGTSKIDIVAVDLEADPPNSQSCINSERVITLRAQDAFDNRDTGSYGNPVTRAGENLTVYMTEGIVNNTTDFSGSSLVGALFSPANPPGDANSVQGNLSSGVGTVNIIDSEPAPGESVTINAVSSLVFEPSGGAVTYFGNNVCLTARNVTGTQPPAGQGNVLITDLKLSNGLAETIYVKSIQFNPTSNQTVLDSEVARVELWHENNANIVCDSCYPAMGSGDTVIATGILSSGGVTFSGLGFAVPASTIEYFYLTYDLQNKITDGRVLDLQVPVNGFTYATPATMINTHTLDPVNVSDSAGTSKVNIVANTLEIFPRSATATLTVDCTNCTTLTVDDISIFTVGEQVLIDDSNSEAATGMVITAVAPTGATQTTPGTVTLSAPATGTFGVANAAYISNIPSFSRSIIVKAIDQYGNIASDPGNTTYEASEQVTVTADNNAFPPDSADCRVQSNDMGGANGSPSTTGSLTLGDGVLTLVENSCQSRRVLVAPSTLAAGYTLFNTASYLFPGRWQTDGTGPTADAITLNTGGGCVTTPTPEIDPITGTDDCAGITGVRFACDAALLNTAPWVPLGEPQLALDICCNCDGDIAPRNVGCGFNLVNGKTCPGYFNGATCLDGATDMWQDNTGADPTGGCGGAAMKTVYVQLKDRAGNVSNVINTAPPVVIDPTPPAITAFNFTSDKETFFYGTADHGTCTDASITDGSISTLPVNCPLWYNNLAGEGASQTMTVQVTYDEAGSTSTLRTTGAAFGEAIKNVTNASTGSGLTTSVTYMIDSDAVDSPPATTTITFVVEDYCGNTASETFSIYKDNSDPANGSITAYASSTNLTALSNWAWYNYANPYFTWADAVDQPPGTALTDNAGLRDYYYIFNNAGADPPDHFTTATNTAATDTLVSGNTYYFKVRSYDNVNNYPSATDQIFVYRYDADAPNNPSVTAYDTSAMGATLTDSTWYNYSNPHFTWAGAVDLPAAPGNSGIATYTYYFGTDPAGTPDNATTATAFTSTAALVTGYTYYLRMSTSDNAGNATTTSTVFTYKYDSTAPDNTPVSAYDSSGKSVSLTDSVWYKYPNPYFEWTAATDLPAAPANSGINLYNIYFGTDPAGLPTTATTTAVNYTATGVLVSGQSYYLRVSAQDNAGNATAVATMFTYKFDNTAPTITYNDPTGGGATPWYSSDPGAVIDVDLIWGNESPLTWFRYWNGAAWVDIFSGNQSADYATDWAVNWAAMVEGRNEIRLTGYDEAGNQVTDPWATGATGFLFLKDVSAPDAPAGPASAWATDSKAVVLTSGSRYAYPNPYFEWSAPNDNPFPAGTPGTDNAGLSFYYIAFSTDTANPVFATIPATQNSFYATPPACGATYTLMVKAADAATPSANVSATASLFTYVYAGDPTITNNQAGNDTWYNADPGAIWDVDFDASPCAPLDYAEYAVFSATGGAGTLLKTWTPIFGPGYGGNSYTANWSLDFAAATDGFNYVSVRAADTSGNLVYATDAFYLKKDTIPPNNTSVTAYATSGMLTTLIDSAWYNFGTPYFVWAAASDLPTGIDGVDNSGFATYNYYFGTDTAGTPDNATTGTNFTSTASLVCGSDYYFRMANADVLGNATSATTLFTYTFDGDAPSLQYTSPATGSFTPWYSADPGNVIDIDLLWGGCAPLTQFDYQIGAAAWTTIWSGNQISDVTADWGVAWASLADGVNAISIAGYDEAGNGATDSYASNTAGFWFRKDTQAPDAPASPANAWDTVAKALALTSGNSYDYANPYFEWAAPADNPAGVDGADNSGVSYYYIAFSTDSINPVFATIPATQNNYTAAPTACGSTYTLMVKTVDSATPTANVSATASLFTYVYGGPLTVTDNQADDATWYNADPGAIWDVDFGAPSCTSIDYAQYTLYSANNGGGSLIKDWTYIIGPGYGLNTYSANWGVDFAAAADGVNYVSVRLTDALGNITYATDVFSFKKDTIPPNNTSVTAYATSGMLTTLVDSVWYNFGTPYFVWAAAADLPLGVDGVDNSGFATYNFYFGTDTTGTPDNATTGTSFTSTASLVCGSDYYFRMANSDFAGNATSATTLFTYTFDGSAPSFTYTYPATGSFTPWYSADPGNVIDIDLDWGGCAPLTQFDYQIGAASWTTIWAGNQASDVTTDWNVKWASLTDGINEISIAGYDEAGNGATDSYATNTAGFWFRKDTQAPDAPAGPANAWDTIAQALALTSGNTYDYANPYFEWTAPADNPAGVDGTDNSGVSYYYIAFSTDVLNPVFATIPVTQNNYTAAPTACGSTYNLMVKAVDSATPTANVSATASLFTYVYGGSLTVTDNQADDATWYKVDPGAIWDVDFGAPACTSINYAQYTIYSALNGGGTLIKDWAYITGPGYGLNSYNADWGVDFAAAADGVNYVSVRLADALGNITYATDVFSFRKDTIAPDATVVAGYDASGKAVTLTDGGWYKYPNPYFEWASPVDLPAGVDGVDNSGFKLTNIYFGTDPAGAPLTATTTATNYTATGVLVSGQSYYLRISNEDNAGNASTTATVFTYKFDNVAPTLAYNDPAAGGTTPWYSSDPGAVNDVDLIWGNESPLMLYRYWNGAAWVTIFSGSQASDYTTNWSVNWAVMVEGRNEIRLSGYDEATNQITHPWATGATGFLFLKDVSAPDAPTGPANAWDTSAKGIALTSGSTYDHGSPYFEWSAPNDNPFPAGIPGTDNAGVSYYYIAFSTDTANPVFATIPVTQNFFTATPTSCGATYSLMIKAADAATPSANVSATATMFTYVYGGGTTVTNNQSGNDTWYNADPGAIWDVDFGASACAPLDYAEYTMYSGVNGTGSLIKTWTKIFGPGYGAYTYTADWALDFAAAADGINYVSVRVVDTDGGVTYATDAFYLKKDTIAPDIASINILGYDSAAKTYALTNDAGAWWNFNNPYFEWANISDLPSAPADSSGISHYAVYFGTNVSQAPTTTFATAATVTFTAPEPNTGQVPTPYYLILSAEDVAGNVSTRTIYYYNYDDSAPSQPTNVKLYDDNVQALQLATGTWYSYPDPYIDWTRAADLGSGVEGYYITFATDASYLAADPSYFSRVDHYDVAASGPVLLACNKYRLYLRTKDYVRFGGNVSATATITDSEYWYDPGPPSFAYNSPSAGGATTWYSQDPGNVVDIDLLWGGCGSPLTRFDYRIGAGAWASIWTGSQSANYTPNWRPAWAALSEGPNFISIAGYDAAGNGATDPYATAATGFVFRKDVTAPDNPAVVAGYDTDAMGISLTSGNLYDYANPYFTWAAPSDNPFPGGTPGTDHAGVAGYLVAFSTDAAAVPSATQTGTSYYATPTVCNATYTLRMRTFDAASPANVSAAASLFTYRYQGNTAIGDNQADDPAWYSSDPGAVWDVDFTSSCDAIDSAQYTIWSGPNTTGTELKTWTAIVGPGYGGFTYNTDWALDFAAATDGVNYVTVKLVTALGNVVSATDVFSFNKDSQAPNKTAEPVTGWASDGLLTALTNNGTYDYYNPYFQWAAPADNPAGVAGTDNSGVGAYLVAFGTDAANLSYATQTATAYHATPTQCDATYSLYIKTVDSATPSPNISATATAFTFKFAGATTITDNQADDLNWYSSDTGKTWDVDFISSCATMDYAQYTIWSGPNQTGLELKTWTNIVGPGYGAYIYLTDWPLDFAAATDGVNFVSVKMVTSTSNTVVATDVFTFRKDQQDPNTPAATGYATDGKLVTLTTGNAYDYTNPYFEWAAPSDNPAGVDGTDNSGINSYYIAFSTDTVNPTYETVPYAQTYYYATPTACGATYTLLMKTVDSATPAANVSATATLFEYYFTGVSSVSDNQSGDDTWYNTDPGAVFDVDFNSPCFNIDTIEYVVYSAANQGGTKIIDWTPIAGPGYGAHSFSAGWGLDFGNATEGYNYVSVRMTDTGAGVTTATDVFYLKKDTLAPTITAGAFSESSNFLWVSPADSKLYYGSGMGAPQSFTLDGTATDTSSGWAVSGVATATFSAAFDDTPADDTTPATWSGTYDIEASNTGGATITVTVYDAAGNLATAEYYAVNNNALSVTYATISKTWRPSYAVFRIYYPDGVTELTASGATGIQTSWLSLFNVGSADVTADFTVNRMAYDAGACQAASGAGAWCMEYIASQCRPAADDPHYIGLNGNSTADGFNTTLAQELSTAGDLGDGTFTATPGPDYLVVKPEGDGIVYADKSLTEWCAGGACAPACAAAYCSSTTNAITAKPDYVKYDNGGAINQALSGIADDSVPATTQWSWDTANSRVMLFDDPAAATVTYTLGSGSEKVCVYLTDSCDQTIDTGKWASVTVLLTLSQAPGSGMDISDNMPDATHGFSTVSLPASGDFSAPDQIEIKGKVIAGSACINLTAETMPNDSPTTPIRVDALYYDPDTGATVTLSKLGGNYSPALVAISDTAGVASGTTTWLGVASEAVIFQPTPDDSTLTITMSPTWSMGGGSIAFVSRQSNPCDGSAAMGTGPFDNFNIYVRKYSGAAGDWNECLRLTRNTTDGADYYGPLAASDVTFSPDDSKIVFAGTDIGGTGADKLFWVSATAPVATPSLGSQADVAISDPLTAMSNLSVDATAGNTTVTVGFVDPTFAVGQQVIVGDLNFTTSLYDNLEIKTISALGANTITFDSPLGSGYSAFTASTFGTVQYPVTFSALGQNISSMADDSYWYDPAWSPTEAQSAACADPPDPAAGKFGDALAVVRWSPSGTADYSGTAPGYANGGNTNPNIIMFYGNKAGSAPSDFYKYGTSDIAKITNFSGNTVQPLKPKWSPDCSKLAFIAWDRSVSDTPAQTSIYVINLNDTRAGWATASLPVSSLTATGVYPIYDYTSRTMPGYFPNWSADSKLVSYSVDRTNTLDLLQIGASNDSIVNVMFSGLDFDTYLEYVEDQPAALGGVTSPQIIGRRNDNEFGMTQCPGALTGSTCPQNPAGSGNYSFTFVSQPGAAQSATLKELILDNVSNVSNEGGLLFLDGIITAVFPPGVISSDTVFWNQTPTAYCVTNPDQPGSHCPVEPTGEYIVNAGEAREFFPDGTNFDGYVRLIFHYCDNDNDGNIDTGTEGSYDGFTFNTADSKCYVAGNPTATGTIDINSLAVYNWDDTAAAWVKLEGTVDRTSKTITVYSTHFSRYDTFGFRMGGAPQAITPLQLANIHTYPNPWRSTDGAPLRFAADAAAGDGSLLVDIKIYDVRGSLVASVSNVVPKTGASYPTENNGVTLASWDVVNRAGRPLASGVYLFYLQAKDLTNGTVVSHTGKLSIIH